MILKDLNFNSLVKILYSTLIEITGLENQCVLNKDTVSGPELRKMINERDAMSFDIADCFILFEVVENEDSENNFITRESDTEISSVMEYNFNITCYGNNSHNLSQKIISRFKDEELLLKLREFGIKINGASHPSNIKEFINNILWVRTDITIPLCIRYSTEIPNVNYFSTDEKEYFSSIKII